MIEMEKRDSLSSVCSCAKERYGAAIQNEREREKWERDKRGRKKKRDKRGRRER